jgi:hypothetical protein
MNSESRLTRDGGGEGIKTGADAAIEDITAEFHAQSTDQTGTGLEFGGHVGSVAGA